MSLNHLREELAVSILKLAGEKKTIEWNRFIEENSSIIIKSYKGDGLNSFKGVWKRKFQEISKELALTITRDNSSADLWQAYVLNQIKGKGQSSSSSSASSKTSSSSPATSGITSSIQYQKQLSKDDIIMVKIMHEMMNGKWELKSGTIVEDVLYAEAKRYNYEHPFHSYILSVNDDYVTSMFATTEIKEIEETSVKTELLKPLPKYLYKVLLNLDKKNTFKAIDDSFQGLKFNRLSQPEEYWLRESVLNYLNLFIAVDTPTFQTEQDLLDDMFGFIKAVKRISDTTTEKTSASKASSENKNSKRDIGSVDKVKRQACAERADLVFKYSSSEIGCVEISLQDNGPNGTKEMNERRIKVPRMLRSFCFRIINQYKVSPAGIKTVGIIISGPFITCKVMSFSKGSVGLVYSSPRLKMPERLSEIAHLLPPVLTLIYNCAMIMKETTNYIRDSTSSVALDPFSSIDFNFFPPPFVSDVDSKKKKRKI